MAWTTPKSWTDIVDDVSAANLNLYMRDNQLQLKGWIDALTTRVAALEGLRPFAEQASFGDLPNRLFSTSWRRFADTVFFQAPTGGQWLVGWGINGVTLPTAIDWDAGIEVGGHYRPGAEMIVHEGADSVFCVAFFDGLTAGTQKMYPVLKASGSSSIKISEATFTFFGWPIPTWSEITGG